MCRIENAVLFWLFPYTFQHCRLNCLLYLYEITNNRTSKNTYRSVQISTCVHAKVQTSCDPNQSYLSHIDRIALQNCCKRKIKREKNSMKTELNKKYNNIWNYPEGKSQRPDGWQKKNPNIKCNKRTHLIWLLNLTSIMFKTKRNRAHACCVWIGQMKFVVVRVTCMNCPAV